MALRARPSVIAIQPDGKIVTAGTSNYEQDTGLYLGEFGVTRQNADGSLDASFSDDGRQTTSFGPNLGAYAQAVALQADGKIVVAGNQRETNVENPYVHLAVVRYRADGSLDPTFSGDGKLTLADFGDYSTANAVAIQADGKIVVAGTGALVRLNPDGSFDPGFSDDGKVSTEPRHPGHSDPGRRQARSRGRVRGLPARPVSRGRCSRPHVLGRRQSQRRPSGTAVRARGRAPGRWPDRRRRNCRAPTSATPSSQWCASGTTAHSTRRSGPVASRPPATAISTTSPPASQSRPTARSWSRGNRPRGTTSRTFSAGSGLPASVRTDSPDGSFGTGGNVVSTIGFSSHATAAALQPDGKIVIAGIGTTFPAGSSMLSARYQGDAPAANAAPTARSAFSCSGLTCYLDAHTSSDPDGSVAAYRWDFGDGTSATGSYVRKVFAQYGAHSATLTVTDGAGATGTQARTLTLLRLTVTGSLVGGFATAQLSWNGTAGTMYGVYRGSKRVGLVSANTITDRPPFAASGTYSFAVCEAYGPYCSASEIVRIPSRVRQATQPAGRVPLKSATWRGRRGSRRCRRPRPACRRWSRCRSRRRERGRRSC